MQNKSTWSAHRLRSCLEKVSYVLTGVGAASVLLRPLWDKRLTPNNSVKRVDERELIEIYIARYRHKASVLARIHSRLANSNNRWDLIHTCVIVFLTGLMTFLGFMGTDRILEALADEKPAVQLNAPSLSSTSAQVSAATGATTQKSEAGWPIRKALFEIIFNLGVLLLFIASLFNLIFRWKDRYTAHFSGVVKLRQFIGWLDELKLLTQGTIDQGKLKYIRHRYDAIVELLPPNSDKDYERSKHGISSSKGGLSVSGRDSDYFPLHEQEFILRLVSDSPATMQVLKVAAAISSDLWLGGGSVRTLTWNYLTGRQEGIHDYDVVYFDSNNLEEAEEKRLEAELKKKLPRSLNISVKNQARMHKVNREPRRDSLEDAIYNWPERATAHALRLNKQGKFVVIAPHGYDDVLDLIVRPTPYHKEHPAAFKRRIAQKQWKKHWPELVVVEEIE